MKELFEFCYDKFMVMDTSAKIIAVLIIGFVLACSLGQGLYESKIIKRRDRFYDDIHKLAENSDKEDKA